MDLKKYDITTEYGYKTTVLLSDDDAKERGLKGKDQESLAEADAQAEADAAAEADAQAKEEADAKAAADAEKQAKAPQNKQATPTNSK